MGWRRRIVTGTAIAAVSTMLVAGGAIAANDFGQKVQDDLESKSNQLFGFVKAVDASSTTSGGSRSDLATGLRRADVVR